MPYFAPSFRDKNQEFYVITSPPGSDRDRKPPQKETGFLKRRGLYQEEDSGQETRFLGRPDPDNFSDS